MSTTTPDDWIGVAEVAAELHLGHRAAWEILRRAGMKMLNPRRMTSARFRRSDWEAARDASLERQEPRAPYTRPGTTQAPARPKPATKAKGEATYAELRARAKKGE